MIKTAITLSLYVSLTLFFNVSLSLSQTSTLIQRYLLV